MKLPRYGKKYASGGGAVAAVCAALLIFAAISPFFPALSDFGLYDNVIRLHVIANSDTDEDQAEKLRVRDAVLDFVDGALTASNKADAKDELERILPEIESAAGAILPDGRAVKAVITNERYPRKSYGAVTLPAGTYTSLRVIIGDGEGHNWWCVLFPKMCTRPAVSGEALEREFVDAGFTPSQYRIITDSSDRRYTVKFRIIEIIKSLFG